MDFGRPTRTRVALGAALVVATAWTFWRVVGLPFISLDDPEYVTQNPDLRHGLTLEAVWWALTTGRSANWHPVTWLSHALDVELFGLDPAGPHAVNLVLHCASALLLFLVFERLTAAPWRSAFLAALFALHPLRVESVAWVSERKDTLACFFWLATTAAWMHHVRTPSRARLTLAAALFAMGLASKPMLVTLPFTLLLLDVWPSRRLDLSRSPREAWPLVREKLPLFVLSAASSVITFSVQNAVGAVRPLATVSLGERAANAVLAVAGYLWRWIWPADLAIFYPYPPARPSAFLVAVASIGLVAATVLAWRLRARAPHLLVGWLWFLGTLVPVIGLVQVGNQALADRYTYVPSIGLGLALVWSIPSLERLDVRLRAAAAALAMGVLLASSLATVRQLGFWRSDEQLFEHAIQVTGRNWLAEQVLGYQELQRGDLQGAVRHYREALRDRPDSPQALDGLGNALLSAGARDEGIAVLREAVRRWPRYAAALANLGAALCESGKLEEGIAVLREALRQAPEHPGARFNLGLALLEAGRPSEALREMEALLRARPDDGAARAYVQRLRALGVGAR